MKRVALIATFLVAAACARPSGVPSSDADVPAIPREMRGVWVATVRNIDWPSTDTLNPERQRAELIDLLDRIAEAGFNTVVFQVRPASDAVYRSSLEPWSALLMGTQGTDPGYDPLEFAVEQAHARGLELHTWINPYRAGWTEDSTTMAPTHVWNARRDLVRVYGPYLWLDPGEPDALEHSLRVVADIVRRYDVDGIHMDDYFYPYPVRDSARGGNLAFPDSGSYARSGSTLGVDDWRRANIDRFVERLYREARAIKPAIKVGISPFGIWRPNHPSGVCCFDAYSAIYADARRWLQSGWVDYFVPQLYWAVQAPQQPFPELLDWWIEQDTLRRHVWPGLATYRAARRANGFATSEIAEQVGIIRSRPRPPGHVMFNTTTTVKEDGGVLRTLLPLYKEGALVPAFPWLDAIAPSPPTLTFAGRTLHVSAAERPRFWAVQMHTDGGLFRRSRWTTRLVSGDSGTIVLPTGVGQVAVSAINLAGQSSSRSITRVPR